MAAAILCLDPYLFPRSWTTLVRINKQPDARFKSLLELVRLARHDRTLIRLMIAACISLAIGISTEG